MQNNDVSKIVKSKLTSEEEMNEYLFTIIKNRSGAEFEIIV